MRRDELIELASPPCSECGEPIRRVEIPWQLNGDGDWVPANAVTVCAQGHRVPVAPLDPVENVPESVEVMDARWNCERRGHRHVHPNGLPSARCLECGS